MKINLFLILVGVLFFTLNTHSSAQPKEDWDQEKIRGEIHYLRSDYKDVGLSYTDWYDGHIEFESGEKLENITLRFNLYLNELLTFNTKESQLIQIDKASVKSFVLRGNGNDRLFEKHYLSGFIIKGQKYVEVLHLGTIKLYCLRYVELRNVTPYKDVNDIFRNMRYFKEDRYYILGDDQLLHSTGIKRKAILDRLDKEDKKKAKRIFWRSKLRFTSEQSFINAIKLLDAEGIKLL